MHVELQNCVAEAHMELSAAAAAQAARIEAELGAGKVVVVRDSEWRCKSTDATVGNFRAYVASHASREEATELCRVLSIDDYESRFHVLPALAPQVTANGDDLPF